MLFKLALNSWVQEIPLPQSSKYLSLQVHTTTPGNNAFNNIGNTQNKMLSFQMSHMELYDPLNGKNICKVFVEKKIWTKVM
jgi:hypothetical protein